MKQTIKPFLMPGSGILSFATRVKHWFGWLPMAALAAGLASSPTAYAGGAGPNLPSNPIYTPPPPVTNPRPSPPTFAVNAGSDQTVSEGGTVTLSGSSGGSSERWSQTAGTTVTLSSTTARSPTFTAPQLMANEVLTFRFSASKSWSWCRRNGAPINYGSCAEWVNETTTRSDTVNITVSATNASPVAAAGSDQRVDEYALVTLDGSGSSDSDSSIQSYAWSQTKGATVVLQNANKSTATFRAPYGLTKDAVLEFMLTVTDTGSASGSDRIQVTVANGVPRVADAALTSRPASGHTYGLGETIRARLTLSEVVAVTGSPALSLTVGSQARAMTYSGLKRGRVLDFEYTVAASDADANGVSIGTGALTLPTGASLANDLGEHATLGLSSHAITNASAHRVDGSQNRRDPATPGTGVLPSCTPTGT